MKKAYETPELEICRFDLEEHLAKHCGKHPKDNEEDDCNDCSGGGPSFLNSLVGGAFLQNGHHKNGTS